MIVARLLNPITVRAFNAAYFRANATSASADASITTRSFIRSMRSANWNAIYGRNGFLQYQCVIPEQAGLEPVAEILDRVPHARNSRRSSP
jgi:decaprenylphospho-beta-D-ribofuranose 2-oxidase